VLMNFGNSRAAPSLALTPEAAPPPKTAPVAAQKSESPASLDWLSVGLGLLALITVLGLVPFWVWVYFVYNPPIR